MQADGLDLDYYLKFVMNAQLLCNIKNAPTHHCVILIPNLSCSSFHEFIHINLPSTFLKSLIKTKLNKPGTEFKKSALCTILLHTPSLYVSWADESALEESWKRALVAFKFHRNMKVQHDSINMLISLFQFNQCVLLIK